MALNNIILGIDCDGVLTDYRCYFDESGRSFKVFNSNDSYAIKDLLKLGVQVVIVTSDIEGYKHVKSRADRWGVQCIASTDKAKTLKNIQGTYDNDVELFFVGNGPEDLKVIDMVNLFFAPADSRPEILNHDSKKIKILSKLGGEGVVDEVYIYLRSKYE